jgi:hypothetical protein
MYILDIAEVFNEDIKTDKRRLREDHGFGPG